MKEPRGQRPRGGQGQGHASDEQVAAQHRFLREVVAALPALSSILASQFAACLVEAAPHCGQCLVLTRRCAAAPLPAGVENPLPLDAQIDEAPGAAQVLLWHEAGFVEQVEICWFGQDHPLLGDLRLITDASPRAVIVPGPPQVLD